MSLIAALGNTLDPLLAVWLLTQVFKDFDIRLSRQHDLWLLLLCGGLAGPLVGAAIGAPVYLFGSSILPQDYARAFMDWWMSTFLTVVILVPLLLMLACRPSRSSRMLQRPWEAAALVLSALATQWVAWQQLESIFQSKTGILIVVPFFVWAAARVGQRGTALLALLVYGFDLAQTHQQAMHAWDLWLLGIMMTLCGQFVAVMFNERSLTEQALRESEERHRLSQKYGGIGAWEADLINSRQIWSENCSQLLGFPALEKPTWEDFLKVIHPEDRPAVVNATHAHIEHDLPYNIEYRIIMDDGRTRWMRSVGQAERDVDGKPVRMRGTVEDVTDRVLLAQALSASENRYRALLQDAGDAILVADLNGNIEEINRAGEQLLGYSRDEICRMSVARIHPVDELPRVRRYFEDMTTNGHAAPAETRILRKDGQVVNVEIRPTLVEIGGRKVAQGIFIDLTERKRIEQERQAQDEAQRDALVREVHHRIKNNLQGITGILRQFSEQHPELAEALEDAIGQVNSIALIHGLLGKTSQADVRFCELTSAIAAGIESIWQKPIVIDIPSPWHPCRITESEAVPLALVLNELVSNSVKHGDEDSPVSITIRHEPGPDTIRLTIRNTGSIPLGLSMEDTSSFGTGLHLTASLLPREGARLIWSQEGRIVMTTLDLDKPIVYLET